MKGYYKETANSKRTMNSMQSGESQQEESEENIDITAEEAEAVIDKLKSDKAPETCNEE